MCYSAKASFTASAVLLVVGVLTLSKTKKKTFIPFALIPVFFSLQQFAEGIVWLDNSYSIAAKNAFLFFALVFWPIWMPTSLLVLETKATRKTILKICLIAGLFTGLVLSSEIPNSTIQFHESSISYMNNSSKSLAMNLILTVSYATATIGSLLGSTLRKIKFFGLLAAVSAVIVMTLKSCCFGSLWCFWSAITSLLIYDLVKDNSIKN